MNIDKAIAENLIKRLVSQEKTVENTIGSGFLPEEGKQSYLEGYRSRAEIFK